jgi:hypothetical protein
LRLKHKKMRRLESSNSARVSAVIQNASVFKDFLRVVVGDRIVFDFAEEEGVRPPPVSSSAAAFFKQRI